MDANYQRTVMPFQKGNKLSPGGKKGNKGGRPSKEKLALMAEMKQTVEEYLVKHVGPVLEAALKISTGVKRRKYNPKTGQVYYEIEYDGAMIRDWISKFVPPAKISMDVTHGTPEEFYRAIAEAKRAERAEKSDHKS